LSRRRNFVGTQLSGSIRGNFDNEVAALERSLQRVRHEVSMVVIAHHLDFVMRLADTVTVLDFGRVIASGTPEAVRNDSQVVEAYVGAAED
jgi:branched-chain amino acid transport system ATP-binding protein